MGQKMAFFPLFVDSNNHKAGSLDSHLENFAPLKKNPSSSVYLTSNMKVRPSDRDKHFTLISLITRLTHGWGKTHLFHKSGLSRFTKLPPVSLCFDTASGEKLRWLVLPDFSNSPPTSSHLLNLQLIPTARLKVLVRKEAHCLPNAVFSYKQPFFSSALSTAFLLRSYFFFLYGSLSEMLVLKSLWEGDLHPCLNGSVITVPSVAASSFGLATEEQFRLVFQSSLVNAATPCKKRIWRSTEGKKSL